MGLITASSSICIKQRRKLSIHEFKILAVGSRAPDSVVEFQFSEEIFHAKTMAPPEFLFSATICCYNSVDLEKILILGRGESTFICIEEKFCCAANDTPLPVGMVKEDGFICKLGLYCCTAGLKKPDMKNLISGVGHVLCFKSIAQFPFGDKGAFAPPHGPSVSDPLSQQLILSDCVHAPPVCPQSASRCALSAPSPSCRRRAA